jgi:hypothetical protein
MFKDKKNIVFVLIILILIGVIVFFYDSLNKESEEKIVIDDSIPEAIGGQKDEYGCLAGAGYSWCESSQKCMRLWEEGCDDEIFKLSEVIKEETGINFIDQGKNTFNWLTRDDNQNIIEKPIEGRRMEAKGIDIEKSQQVEKFFDDNGNQNTLNIADGVFAGLRGYTYHYMVCILSWEQEGDKADIQIDCGFFNK